MKKIEKILRKVRKDIFNTLANDSKIEIILCSMLLLVKKCTEKQCSFWAVFTNFHPKSAQDVVLA